MGESFGFNTVYYNIIALRPFMASYSTVTPPFMFNVISGGFENVWTSQLNGQKWIEIDLGQSRTIRALTIRGGHYMGTVCTPVLFKINII